MPLFLKVNLTNVFWHFGLINFKIWIWICKIQFFLGNSDFVWKKLKQIFFKTILNMRSSRYLLVTLDTLEAAVSQPLVSCSKLTLESLEQGVKYVQIGNRDTRTVALFWYLYCNFEHISHLGLVFLLLTLSR